MPPPSGNKAAHSGKETRRRRYQKSETGCQWLHRKELYPPKIRKKIKIMVLHFADIWSWFIQYGTELTSR